VYETLQYIQLVVFLPLLFSSDTRVMAAYLMGSAVLYLSAGDYFLSFDENVYLIRGGIDLALAHLIYFGVKFTKAGITAGIGAENKGSLPQPLILVVFTMYHLAAYMEFPTEHVFFYNSYGPVTNALNILQMLVVWRLLKDVMADGLEWLSNCDNISVPRPKPVVENVHRIHSIPEQER
jgi:hypothetical protein